MTPPRLGLACVFALVCALGCALPAAARAGEIIVARDSGLSAAERADLRADAGVRHKRMLRLPQSEVVTVPDRREAAALRALNADPDVRYAEPVVQFQVAASDDDLYDRLWAHENISQPFPPRDSVIGTYDADMDVPDAWAVSRGAGQTVAVIDTGIQESHADLAANIAPGARSFIAGSSASGDGTIGHGTRVAGVIAAVADNGIGVAGVAPEAKLLSLKAFDDYGFGASPAVAEALDYAGDLGLRVVNLSFDGPDSQAVREAIASHPATLFVVAAGNGENGVEEVGDNVDAPAGGDNGSVYPCTYPEPNLICVGATDLNDDLTVFSNYGATSVDLFAPGQLIYTTLPYLFVPYGSARGTSISAPMVAAEAALMLAAHPNLSTASLRLLLLRSVDPIPSGAGRSVTGGRANAGTLLTTPVVDGDGDGVLDEIDSCPTAYDPSQSDADGDGIGDPCDPTPRGDDADGDSKALLDDKCPTVFGAEPDGCPPTIIQPPGNPQQYPPTPTPTPTPAAGVVTVSVKVTPKKCPRGRSGCLKAAKVTVRLTRAATASLRFEQRVKRGGKLVWKAYTTKPLKATTSARSFTLKRLKAGSYRVTVIVAGKGKTKNFRV